MHQLISCILCQILHAWPRSLAITHEQLPEWVWVQIRGLKSLYFLSQLLYILSFSFKENRFANNTCKYCKNSSMQDRCTPCPKISDTPTDVLKANVKSLIPDRFLQNVKHSWRYHSKLVF